MPLSRRTTLVRAIAVRAAFALAAPAAWAQVDKPVRLLVGLAPGGSADIAARLIAERMKDELKEPVRVENRPGAGGRIVAEVVQNSPPDGSILMLTPIVVTALAPMVFTKLPYDPIADFAPAAQVANFQFALSVNATDPANNVGEFVGWHGAKPRTGQLHFFGVMISKSAGLDLVHVPFDGGGPMMNALMGDQITAGFDTFAEPVELHRTGRVRMAQDSARWAPIVKASGFRGD